MRKQTIVIFMSDHGYNLGEHGCWSKSSLWEGSIRAPVIVSVPGKAYEGTYGSTSETIVELLDLYPTLVDLTGFSSEKPPVLQGKSLMPQIKGKNKSSADSYAYTITNDESSLRTDRWRYTRWGANPLGNNEELYDHNNDPEELENLVGEENHTVVLDNLRKKLEEVRNKAKSGLKNIKYQ